MAILIDAAAEHNDDKAARPWDEQAAFRQKDEQSTKSSSRIAGKKFCCLCESVEERACLVGAEEDDTGPVDALDSFGTLLRCRFAGTSSGSGERRSDMSNCCFTGCAADSVWLRFTITSFSVFLDSVDPDA